MRRFVGVSVSLGISRRVFKFRLYCVRAEDNFVLGIPHPTSRTCINFNEEKQQLGSWAKEMGGGP